MGNPLAEVLNEHLASRRMSYKQLASAAGISHQTVYRWTIGKVAKAQRWQDLAEIARALNLNRDQANQLLVSGGNPPLDVLELRFLSDDELALLDRWRFTSSLHNLPIRLTSFVGREQEMADLVALLTSETSRLVTLTGPGGSGKTRLALAAAFAVLDEFAEAWFVDLAALRDPERVIPTIAQTIGVPEASGESAQQAVERYLHDRNALLVLDNFEQVLEAGALVTQVLWAAGGVRALVTSRVRLNVRGEHLVEVDPLPLPVQSAGFEELARNPAVALFEDRASAVERSFSLTPYNAPQVADLCARLDGLPLGIELVAVHARTMSLMEMLERFPNRLALATDGPRDVLERQRTLRATIAWSYDLVAPTVQHLFAVLGVFANGFTQEAGSILHCPRG